MTKSIAPAVSEFGSAQSQLVRNICFIQNVKLAKFWTNLEWGAGKKSSPRNNFSPCPRYTRVKFELKYTNYSANLAINHMSEKVPLKSDCVGRLLWETNCPFTVSGAYQKGLDIWIPNERTGFWSVLPPIRVSCTLPHC